MMSLLTTALILIIAALHVYFCVLEMVLWTKPLGRKTFRMDADFAAKTATLAANQGLYNAFLAAGLIWAVAHPIPETGHQIALFFLACVAVAGAYGGYSVNRRIFFIQGLPALVTLAALLFV